MHARRAFGKAIAAAAAAIALPPAFAARSANQPARIEVVFWITPVDPSQGPQAGHEVRAFVPALEALGWSRGKDITVHFESALGVMNRMKSMLDALVARPPDVIVVTGNLAARELLERTRTIPIVVASLQDPVKAGFVASLARPGGNLTGLVAYEDAALYAKRLALLKEADPRVTRVAFMTSFESIDGWSYAKGLTGFAAQLGVQVFPVQLEHDPARIQPAFDEAVRMGANGVFLDSTLTIAAASQRIIAQQARRTRLPVVYSFSEAAAHGGMLVYDVDRKGTWARVAHYVDRILKGAAPGALPMEHIGRMRLTVNARAAREIGLALPKTLLRRADQVID